LCTRSDRAYVPLDNTHHPVTVAGKTAAVIGGTSGIGRAIALRFAEEGADVVATSRTPEKVERTADEIRERGVDTIEQPCDVTDRDSLEEYRDAAFDAMGHVDILVNSPGAVARSSLADVTDEEWEGVFDVQLDGPVTAVQVFADRRSVAPSSTSRRCRHRRRFRTSPPTTAKGGIDAFTRVAAEELGPEIRVNAIRPGFVVTEQTADTYVEGTRGTIRSPNGPPRADSRNRKRSPAQRCTSPATPRPTPPARSSPWTTASVPLPSTPDSVGRSRVSAIAPTGSAITGK